MGARFIAEKTLMNIIAIDDEPMALEGILREISNLLPSANISGFLQAEAAINYATDYKVDIAFLDIEMYDITGIEVAKQLKELNPIVNIIFSTGYREYMEDAFELYASGYILKPVTMEKVRSQLENLRYPIEDDEKLIRIKTFGQFEVFVQGRPIKFAYSKTKELLAILVDKEGKMVSVGEAISILWENDDKTSSRSSYMKNLQSDLTNTLKNIGMGDVLIKQRGALGIAADKVKCDLYDFLSGTSKSTFHGEYMNQYSWAESRIAVLEEMKCK